MDPNIKSEFEKYKTSESSLISVGSIFSNRFIKDASLRVKYQQNILKATSKIRDKKLFNATTVSEFMERYNLNKNKLPYELQGKAPFLIIEEASKEASALRNSIMDAIRMQTSSITLAYVKMYKEKGKTLSVLLDEYTQSETGKEKFSDLTSEFDKGKVYLRLINGAKKSREKFNLGGRLLSSTSKALLIATYAAAAYNIYNSADKIKETEHQGSMLTGARAGFIFGNSVMPGACALVSDDGEFGRLICVTVGVFVSSAVGG